jgi:hypothetical protein
LVFADGASWVGTPARRRLRVVAGFQPAPDDRPAAADFRPSVVHVRDCLLQAVDERRVPALVLL